MGPTQLFVLILIVHFLADFALQTHDQASLKSTSNKWLLYHVGTYTMVWAIVYFILPLQGDFNSPLGWLAFVTFIGSTHFITDWLTSRVGKPFWEKKDLHNGFVVVGFDQVIHYLCLWYVVGKFVGIIN